MENKKTFISNNFDLIRLIAALQVVFMHGYAHLDIKVGMLSKVLSYLPGVPIFFFISGYLISSYVRNDNIFQYAINRVIRIYPALIVCTLLSILAVYLTGYFSNHESGVEEFFIWILGQISFVQFYNPGFMREFGTGVLNGSLWTISVELQFYFIIPLLYFFISKTRVGINTVLVLLITLFVGVNQLYVILGDNYSEHMFYKLFHVSFAPWFYMFLVGVFFQHNFAKIYSLTKKFRIVIGVLSILYITIITIFDISMGNSINPVAFSVLAILLFFIAYSSPEISDYVLRRNDISYGVYIYHIPIINIFIYYGYVGSTGNFISMIILTIMVATFSWVIVERPSLLLKKKTIHSLLKNK